jgi:phage host-nuclease inhibitor protein Gam
MENDLKKYIEEQTEKLAAMVAEGFASTATKQEVSDLRQEVGNLGQEVGDLRTEMRERFDNVEANMAAGFAKRLQEHDELRDRLRLLETRVDKLETVHR